MSIAARVALTTLVLLACGDASPKPAAPASPEVKAPAAVDAGAIPTPADAGAASASRPATYRLVVSFISHGAGTDAKARDQVVEIFNKWRIAKGLELKTERPHWGKEGEMDVCAELKELSEPDRAKFVTEVKAAAGKNDRVQILENAACHTPNPP